MRGGPSVVLRRPRNLLPPALFLLTALVVGGCAGRSRPNLLLITIDTLRADHLGAYGYRRKTSPRLDAFARASAVFEAAQATSSWTLPTLASIMTSFYTSTHRCWGYRSRLDESFSTLAEQLFAAGYDTAAVVNHVFLDRSYGLGQGFVHFDDDLIVGPKRSHAAVTSDVVADKALWYLRQKAGAANGSPWFLWIHFFDPHEVYKLHEGISEEFGTVRPRDRYDGEIAFTDLHVGRVLQALDDLELEGRTVVAVVADHGEEFRDHGGHGHGHSLYGELLRVPLLIRAPGLEPRHIADVVSTIDLMPTLLELLGVEPSRATQGRSLAPLLEGGALEQREVIGELRMAPFESASIVSGRWKLLVDRSEGRRLLYDLEADPSETTDLAARESGRAARLEARLEERVAEARRAAEDYGAPRERDLSPLELERLRALGYVDDGEGLAP